MSELEFLFVLMVAAAGLVRVADAIRIPYPVVLVLAGLAIGFIPGLPDVELAPEVIFLVFLPPLLTAAAYYASPQELRAEKAALTHLALVLVLVTMCAVAVVAHSLVEGISWAGAFVLGAVLAPTDAVAALATYRRAHVPQRVRTIAEGEVMLNDAAPLVAFRIAVGAATGATFDATDAALDFVVSAIGGVAIGLAVGWVIVRVVARLSDPPLAILSTVLASYGSYVLAEELHVSGVLAAVLCGLYLGWHAPSTFDADVRLSAVSFWGVLEFTLNVLIFVLLGLQFPALRDELPVGEVVGTGLAVSATVIVVRLVAQFAPWVSTGDTWQERVVIGWSGMRGAISLAAALSIPLDVPEREEIIVLTFFVIAVTLVGQGLTLAPLIRLLGVREQRLWSPEEAMARLEAAQSALDRLDELAAEAGGELPAAIERLRELYRARFRMCQDVLAGEGDGRSRVHEQRHRYSALRRELIGIERGALLELRAAGELRPETMRMIERELDLDEARLRE